MILKIAAAYFIFISLISAAITIFDKLAAKNRKKRIPERKLMIYAALGGASAMFITMLIIRHKTRHIKFMVGLPLFIAVHITAVCFLLSQVL